MDTDNALRRTRILRRVAVITAVTTFFSVFVTGSIHYLVSGSLSGAGVGLMIAATVPLLIAPIGSWREISLTERLRAANEHLKVLSETDPLTHTLNRRRFVELAGQQLALASRHCYPTSLLLLDFDHFKQINDRYGHAMGDQVLVEATTIIRELCRESDALARFGGEEFILLLPHTAREGALLVAERIMERLRDHCVLNPATGQPTEINVTVSIGGVTSETSDAPLDRMMSRADTLLYSAKQAGRDHCVVDLLPHQPLLAKIA